MTGEEIFSLLTRMAARGDSPRKRERQLRRLGERLGLSSDALRAKARRYARRTGAAYPLMRKPATRHRESERAEKRVQRSAWREDRLRLGREALARGADWAEIATLFGIRTAEGAAQWWRRNPEVAAPRARGKSTRRRRRAAR